MSTEPRITGASVSGSREAPEATCAFRAPVPLWYDGDNLRNRRPTMRKFPETFWEKFTKTKGCWEWRGDHNAKGYGRLTVSGRNCRAHRLSWQLHRGPIPRGEWVLHTCDNPNCVNPAHLFLGTHTDNMRDCCAKGRARTQKSDQHQTHCKRGHRYGPKRTADGRSKCLVCLRATARARRARKARAALNSSPKGEPCRPPNEPHTIASSSGSDGWNGGEGA
jgi:hypothetical protein